MNITLKDIKLILSAITEKIEQLEEDKIRYSCKSWEIHPILPIDKMRKQNQKELTNYKNLINKLLNNETN